MGAGPRSASGRTWNCATFVLGSRAPDPREARPELSGAPEVIGRPPVCAPALPPPEAEGSEQLSQGNPESRRQRPDVDQSGVALAALDTADVHVRALEEACVLRAADLSANSAFLDAACRSAQATSEREKLDALRNAVPNAALPGSPDALIQQMFLRLVDQFGAWHLHALAFLQSPFEQLTALGRATEGLAFATPGTVLAYGYPELRQRDDGSVELSELLVAELERARLVTFEPKEHVLARRSGKTRDLLGNQFIVTQGVHWNTWLGYEFLRFVAAPAPG